VREWNASTRNAPNTKRVRARGNAKERAVRSSGKRTSTGQALREIADVLGSGLQIDAELEPIAHACVQLNHVKQQCMHKKSEGRLLEEKHEEHAILESLLALYMHLERRMDGKRYNARQQEAWPPRNVHLSMQIARQMLLDLSLLNQTLLPQEHPFFLDQELAGAVEKLRPSIDPEEHLILDMVLNKRNGNERKEISAPGAMLSTAHACTTLRALLLRGLGSGLRNDAPERALEMRWRWRHAEIQLELQALADLERLSSPQQNPKPVAEEVLLAITLCLRNSALGNISPKDCLALETHIASWQSDWIKASALGGMEKQRLIAELYAIVHRVKNLSNGRVEDLRGVLDPAGRSLASNVDGKWTETSFFEVEGMNSPALGKLCEGMLLAIQLHG